MSSVQEKPVQNYLRPAEVEECNADKAALEDMMDLADTRAKKARLRKAITQVDTRLQQAPRELTPAERDRVSKELVKLEEEIKVGMLSHEEMRRNPPGAVAQNVAWGKRNSRKVSRWKNLQLLLNRGMSQTDAQHRLNIARLRPRTSQLSMETTQVAGKTFVSGFGDQSDWPEFNEGGTITERRERAEAKLKHTDGVEQLLASDGADASEE